MLKFRKFEDRLKRAEAIKGQRIADIIDQKASLKAKRQENNITEEKYQRSLGELELQEMELSASMENDIARMKMRDILLHNAMRERKSVGVDVYNEILGLGAEVLDGSVAGIKDSKPNDIIVTAEQYIKMWNAAATITSADIAQEADFTDESVYYKVQPLTLLNVITKRSLTNQTVKHIFEDSNKVEGKPTFIKQGDVLPLIDFGTKEDERKLKLVGARLNYDLDLETDSDVAYFLPYANLRRQIEHDLLIERSMINGDGTGNNMKGFMTETGVVTGTAISTGGWTRTKIESFANGINSVLSNVYAKPTHLVIDPLEYRKMQLVWEDNVGYILTEKQPDTPIGDSLSQLFGVPIVTCWQLPKVSTTSVDFIVADFSDTAIYTNGGMIQQATGETSDDMIRLKRTTIQYARVQQYTKNGKAIVKIVRTF